MALFKDLDGTYFDIPKEELAKFKMTSDEAKELLAKGKRLVACSIEAQEDADVEGQSHCHVRTL